MMWNETYELDEMKQKVVEVKNVILQNNIAGGIKIINDVVVFIEK